MQLPQSRPQGPLQSPPLAVEDSTEKKQFLELLKSKKDAVFQQSGRKLYPKILGVNNFEYEQKVISDLINAVGSDAALFRLYSHRTLASDKFREWCVAELSEPYPGQQRKIGEIWNHQVETYRQKVEARNQRLAKATLNDGIDPLKLKPFRLESEMRYNRAMDGERYGW